MTIGDITFRTEVLSPPGALTPSADQAALETVVALGLKGDPGEKGDKGDKGDPGDAGSISTQPNNRLTSDGAGALLVPELTIDLAAIYTLAKE